jgi:3-oxoacyl-[acyl-carrier protein] reductase
MKKLEGKVAIITGSGRGIGREIALKLASEGARVVVNDLDAAPANETVEEIRAAGGQAWPASAASPTPTSASASSPPRWMASAAWTSSSTTPATPGTT